MTFNDMVKAQRDRNIKKEGATAGDLRDAEIFGQIAGLLEQVSKKNLKNLNYMLASYPFRATEPDTIIVAFKRAVEKAEEGSKEWWS